MSNIETLTDNAVNNGEITLTVDEQTRKLQYEGELVLGVEYDCRAERIYFECPQYVGDDIDLSSTDVKIFIDYKNGYNEPYCVECTDKTLTDGVVTFSWLLGSTVTEVKGNVTFTVCAKKIVDGEDYNIWHTVPFTGTVLKGVEPSDHEVIEDITVDTAQLREEVTILQQNLTDAEATIQSTVDAGFETLKEELQNETDPVVVAKANYATKASQDADGNVISDTYVKLSGDQTIDGSITVKDNVNATNLYADGNVDASQITTNFIYIGSAAEVVLDPGDGIFTINEKNILTDSTVEDISSYLKQTVYYPGTLGAGEFADYEIIYPDQIALYDGDKVRFYLYGGTNYPKFQSSVVEVEMVEGPNGEVIGRNSLCLVRGQYSYQTLIISFTVDVDTAETTMIMSVYAITDSTKEAASYIHIGKAEIVRA